MLACWPPVSEFPETLMKNSDARVHPDLHIRLLGLGSGELQSIPCIISVYTQEWEPLSVPSANRDQAGDMLYFSESRYIKYRHTVILCTSKREKPLSIKNDQCFSASKCFRNPLHFFFLYPCCFTRNNESRSYSNNKYLLYNIKLMPFMYTR